MWTVNIGVSVHSHDEDVDDCKNEEKKGTNVVQVVNLALLEFLVEVDSGGVHENKACESGDDNTSGAQTNLSVVKVLEQVVLVSDDELKLNTVGHDDDKQTKDGHDSLLG